jgi:8-oxo-dGTP pyrophosphatase MutT (NUDIX family)
VSLPGGEIEPKETPEMAAVRELGEELGVVPPDLELAGRLSPIHVYASDFHVTTCIGTTGSRPEFIPNVAEVANLVEPSLVDLFEASRVGKRAIRRRGIEFTAPDITFGGESIWGATRMILAELFVLLQSFETD